MSARSSSSELSVLIPALNEGPHLRRTVESVRRTVPAATEVIVVDDGSTDGCADFLRAGSELAVLLLPEPAGERLGAAGARNRAAAVANGDTLVFLDAHVELPAGWSEALLAVLRDCAIGAVCPAIAVLGREQQRGYGLRWHTADLAVEWLPSHGGDASPVPLLPGACVAMRRDVFFACGGFDRGLYPWGSEDAELSLRLWRLGYELRVVPAVEVAHLFRDRHPYAVDHRAVVQNQLRVAFVHFAEERLARVIAALKHHACFASALARLGDGDAFRQRNFMQRHAVRDDDAYFARFGDIQ